MSSPLNKIIIISRFHNIFQFKGSQTEALIFPRASRSRSLEAQPRCAAIRRALCGPASPFARLPHRVRAGPPHPSCLVLTFSSQERPALRARPLKRCCCWVRSLSAAVAQSRAAVPAPPRALPSQHGAALDAPAATRLALPWPRQRSAEHRAVMPRADGTVGAMGPSPAAQGRAGTWVGWGAAPARPRRCGHHQPTLLIPQPCLSPRHRSMENQT